MYVYEVFNKNVFFMRLSYDFNFYCCTDPDTEIENFKHKCTKKSIARLRCLFANIEMKTS